MLWVLIILHKVEAPFSLKTSIYNKFLLLALVFLLFAHFKRHLVIFWSIIYMLLSFSLLFLGLFLFFGFPMSLLEKKSRCKSVEQRREELSSTTAWGRCRKCRWFYNLCLKTMPSLRRTFRGATTILLPYYDCYNF